MKKKKWLFGFGIMIIFLVVIVGIYFGKGMDYFSKQIDAELGQQKSMNEENVESAKEKNCFETNSATRIKLDFGNQSITPNQDIILHLKTNKSIKGRTITLMNQGQSQDPRSEVGYTNEDGQFCYQYIFQTIKDSTIPSIQIENLPPDNIVFYGWVVSGRQNYEIVSLQNIDTLQNLPVSEDRSLIPPSSYMSAEEIAICHQEDRNTMVKKWSEKLGIQESEVGIYLDYFNSKNQGKLHKDGQKMKNEAGEIVPLNGICLFHIPDYSEIYTKESLEALKLWGINCIRIPAYLQLRVSSNKDTITRVGRGLDTAYDETISEMDRIIEIATELGFYCMVDYHVLVEDGDISQHTELAKQFFTHFGEKYGSQNNILWELANEPFGSTPENLTKYVKEISTLIKQYDSTPILITGHSEEHYNLEDATRLYECFQKNGVDDVFISKHYYNGDEIEKYKKAYQEGMPLIFSEWSNASTQDTKPYERYEQMTNQYLEWWHQEGIANVVFMYCHGDYAFSLWKDLGKKNELISHGVIGQEYLTDNGIKVFNDYLEDTINRIKESGALEKDQWDISLKQDQSIHATWKEQEHKLILSGEGEMKDWTLNSEEDFHLPIYQDSIQSIEIGEGITKIGNYAFANCQQLTQITIPQSIEKIGEKVFFGCDQLKQIQVHQENAYFSEVEGVLFNRDKTELIKYPSAKEGDSYTIPKSVLTICTNAFAKCQTLTKLSIANTVTKIQNEAISPQETLMVYCCQKSVAEKYVQQNHITYLADPPTIAFSIPGCLVSLPSEKVRVTVTPGEGRQLDETSLMAQWTTSSDQPEESTFSVPFQNGQEIEQKGVDGKWYLWVMAKDTLGNTAIKSTESFLFDNTPPDVKVVYSQTEPTQEKIVVRIVANEELKEIEGWEPVDQSFMKFEKTYAQNTKEELLVQDVAGNAVTITIEITNIQSPQILGDINGNGMLDISDLSSLVLHLGEYEDYQLPDEQIKIADMNQDGVVDLRDLSIMCCELAKLP